MKRANLIAVLFFVISFFFSNYSYSQYDQTVLDDDTEGGLMFRRKSSTSTDFVQWQLSLRNNNKDLWFYSYDANVHGNPYWNPLQFNYSANRSIILTGGYVGIGTESPAYTLDVGGSAQIKNSLFVKNTTSGPAYITLNTVGSYNQMIFIDDNGTSSLKSVSGSSGYLEFGGTRLNNSGGIRINSLSSDDWEFNYSTDNGGYFYLDEYGVGKHLVVKKNGSVGIGTTNPSTDYKLSVNGKIRSKEVVVEASWSDFVFEETYDLKSLKEVESFIKKNKHLPDVPSEKEITENGVSIGEMQSTLLQKIEELTLYVIEQGKRIEKLEQENAELKK